MKLFRKIAISCGIILLAFLGIVAFVLIRASLNRQYRPREDCPILAWLHPISKTPIASDDYIEVDAGGGWTSWEPIHIRIYGDGRVERDTVETTRGNTFGCPLHPDQRSLHIPAEVARKLLLRARDGGFCRLCAIYQYPAMIFDAGSETLTLSLGGKRKSVWNHEGNPPPLFGELDDTIGKLVPMRDLADTGKFSPARAAECDAFMQQQEELWKSRNGH
jgi:hypothetical protein